MREEISTVEPIVQDGKMFVVCPKCGAMVRTVKTDFESREEADCEALGKCSCTEARAWRRIRVQNVTRLGETSGETIIAACRFCGQTRSIDSRWADGLTPTETVTRLCRCVSAQYYQGTLEAERRREEDLTRAQDNIDTLFSDIEETRREEVTGLLKTCCELVYDRKATTISITLDSGRSAKIGQASKGNIKIVRSDRSSEGVEI